MVLHSNLGTCCQTQYRLTCFLLLGHGSVPHSLHYAVLVITVRCHYRVPAYRSEFIWSSTKMAGVHVGTQMYPTQLLFGGGGISVRIPSVCSEHKVQYIIFWMYTCACNYIYTFIGDYILVMWRINENEAELQLTNKTRVTLFLTHFNKVDCCCIVCVCVCVCV